VTGMAVILFGDMAESSNFGNRPAFESHACCFLLYDLEQASVSLKYKLDIRIVLWGIVMKHIIVADTRLLATQYSRERIGPSVRR